MNRKPYTVGRTYIGRIPRGMDLVSAIAKIANEEGINVATVTVHGSVTRAAVTRFDPETREQRTLEEERGMEIASMTGTISRFKGRAMPRLSATLVSIDGSMLAGTVALGTEVYACEVVITEYLGGTLSRDFDPDSSLPLWRGAMLLREDPDDE